MISDVTYESLVCYFLSLFPQIKSAYRHWTNKRKVERQFSFNVSVHILMSAEELATWIFIKSKRVQINIKICFSLVFYIIGISTVLSTFYDVFTWSFQLKSRESLKACSVLSNFRQLMTINKSESVINCIDGLKVISGLKCLQLWMNSRFFYF